MVLVAKDFRRRGLASRLMRRCIDELVAGGRVPVLDATPDGQQVYRALGLRGYVGLSPAGVARAASVAVRSRRLPASRSRRSTTRSGRSLPPTTPRPSARIAARCWRACADDCRRPNSWRCATAASRDFCSAATAGPARSSGRWSPKTRRSRRRCSRAPSPRSTGPVYIDLADAQCGRARWLETLGFAAQRPFTRMVYRQRRGLRRSPRAPMRWSARSSAERSSSRKPPQAAVRNPRFMQRTWTSASRARAGRPG